MIKDTYTGGNWPGELCTKTSQTYNGMTIWMWEYNGDKTDSPTHIIFNNAAAYTCALASTLPTAESLS